MRSVRFPAALLLALATILPGKAFAGDPPRRTVDKTIEKAAARKAAEKLGELRGMIFEDVTVDFLATGKVGGEAQPSPRTLAPGAGTGTKLRKYPPVVHNDRESFGIDPFATRSIHTAEDGTERVSMVFGAPAHASLIERLRPRVLPLD